MELYRKFAIENLNVQLVLTEEQQCVILKFFSHGYNSLNKTEENIIYCLIGQLKEAIHP